MIVPVERIRQHLVGFVSVVQPVPIDEAVLQSRERNAAAPALERQRASPAAGFRIRNDDIGRERIECGRRFVHGAHGPGKLQQGNARELMPDDRPAITAANHGVCANLGARPERAANAMKLCVERHQSPMRGQLVWGAQPRTSLAREQSMTLACGFIA